jgi:hypothetical protein
VAVLVALLAVLVVEVLLSLVKKAATLLIRVEMAETA